jgi:probable phosphoglycerate mutase
MILYTIRHGETDYNKTLRIQSWRDVPLNQRGLLQAQCAADFLKDTYFDRIISSTLSRAYVTAEIIAATSNYPHIPIYREDRLREINLGVLEGKHEKTDRMQMYFNDPFHYPAPEKGESFLELCQRVDAYMDELISRPDLAEETVLLSTHAVVSRAILRYFHEDKDDFWRGGVPYNCSINIYKIDGATRKIIAQDIKPTGIEDI